MRRTQGGQRRFGIDICSSGVSATAESGLRPWTTSVRRAGTTTEGESRAGLPVAFADRVDGRSPAVESGEDVVDCPGVELSKQPPDVGYEFVVESP